MRRRLQGGVANSAAYQPAISAFGVAPEDDAPVGDVDPWSASASG